MIAFRLNSQAFKRGFRAMLPFWLGAAPFAVAYSIAAQKAGLNSAEIQLMSLTVYSAAAQMGIVQLLWAGASTLTIVVTAVAMSLHHVLYGVSLAKRMRLSRLERVVAAYFLTDSAYGITVANGEKENTSFLFLWGAELSMFLIWNLFTVLGLLLGHLISVPSGVHLDFVGPLTFFILLVLTLKTRLDLGVALISVAITLICLWLQLGSATIFIVGIGGALMGCLIMQNQKRRQNPELRSD